MDAKKMGWITVGLVTALTILTYASLAPDTFTVDSKKWKCVGTRPTGIGAECTILERKDIGGVR